MSHVGLQLHSMLLRPACPFWLKLRFQRQSIVHLLSAAVGESAGGCDPASVAGGCDPASVGEGARLKLQSPLAGVPQLYPWKAQVTLSWMVLSWQICLLAVRLLLRRWLWNLPSIVVQLMFLVPLLETRCYLAWSLLSSDASPMCPMSRPRRCFDWGF